MRASSVLIVRLSLLAFALLFVMPNALAEEGVRPNIIWIVVEDASPHISSYGETTINTPNLDRLAASGIQFDRAFVTCPVCSPSRSAMVTGMYQTTLGAQNHRSQGTSGKSTGTPKFFESYRLPVKSIPRMFQDAGYFTCNSATGQSHSKAGKTDYNFVWNKTDYDAPDWGKREPGQPFFAQIQLRGGKNRKANHGVNSASVNLPPYYPDHSTIRDDWATYLNSWIQTDLEVGAILKRLDDEGIADSTVVFFWTDHGVSHARGKQFLYEEGIRVPLIIQSSLHKQHGIVREDLVTHIDVAATSLAMAGITIPDHVQGVDLFADEYQERDMIFSARDRCDETVDVIRCVRTKRFKYIRNFLPHLPHLQPNQYKDGKATIQTIRQLQFEGKLTALQNRLLTSQRPAEELYDLENDPHETVNLVSNANYFKTAEKLRTALYEWMISSRDTGLIPEPILEKMGHEHGNKYHVLKQERNQNLLRDMLRVIDAKDQVSRIESLDNEQAAIRYWAVTMLGTSRNAAHIPSICTLLSDQSSGVRVAAALALCRLGDQSGAKVLAEEISNENRLTGMYAIRGLEMTGTMAEPYINEVNAAQKIPYEFTRRIARRLSVNLSDTVKERPIIENALGMRFVPIKTSLPNQSTAMVYMQESEITYEQFRKFQVAFGTATTQAERTPSERPLAPNDFDSWDDAATFIEQLNRWDEMHSYRMPTESEWEFACTGEIGGKPIEVTTCQESEINADRLFLTRQSEPNQFGLYDMLGVFGEYCSCHFDHNNDHSQKAEGSNARVVRGMRQRTNDAECFRYSSDYRFPAAVSGQTPHLVIGLRLVMEPSKL